MPSPTDCKTCQAMESILSIYSPLHTPVSMVESSRLIKQSGKGLGTSETSNCRTSINSPISRSRTWIRSGYQSSQVPPKMTRKGNKTKTGKETNRVTNGMTGDAIKRKRNAEDCMSATSVIRENIKGKIVESSELVPKRPKYMQRSVWTGANDSSSCSPTACCTLSDDPLPRPSQNEFSNFDAISTIRDNPHLF